MTHWQEDFFPDAVPMPLPHGSIGFGPRIWAQQAMETCGRDAVAGLVRSLLPDLAWSLLPRRVKH